MAQDLIQLIPPKTATVALETQLTSGTGVKNQIHNFTATNQSTTTTATIDVHIANGSATSSNRLIYEAQVLPREALVLYQLSGKVIPSGQSLITSTSAATLTIECTGYSM